MCFNREISIALKGTHSFVHPIKEWVGLKNTLLKPFPKNRA